MLSSFCATFAVIHRLGFTGWFLYMENVKFEIATLLQSGHGFSEHNEIQEILYTHVDEETSAEHGWNEWNALGKIRQSGCDRETVRRAENSVWRKWGQVKNEQPQSEKGQELKVNGSEIGDLPTEYVINDLQAHELPVIGTYVSKKITTGFKYRVRVLGTNRYLFNGEAKTLLSIGMGYGKRLTFESENKNCNNNYFYSDSFPSGFGFTMVAVSPKETFTLYSEDDREVGQVEVESVDNEQNVIQNEVMKNGTIKMTISVNAEFHIHYESSNHGVMSLFMEESLALQGLAVVKKEKSSRKACLQKIEQVFIPAFGQCCMYKN